MAAEILPVVKGAVDNDNVSVVEVLNPVCRGGFARVQAVGRMRDCAAGLGPQCRNDATVLLRARGEVWSFITVGSGIDCRDSSREAPEIREACAALEP